MTVRSTPHRFSAMRRAAAALAPITLVAVLGCFFGDPAWSASAVAPVRVAVDSACAARGIIATGLSDTTAHFERVGSRSIYFVRATLVVSHTRTPIDVDTVRDTTGHPILRMSAGGIGGRPRALHSAFSSTVRSILAACGDTARADVTYRSEQQ